MLKEISMKDALQATLNGKEVNVFILDKTSVTSVQACKEGGHSKGKYQYTTQCHLVKIF